MLCKLMPILNYLINGEALFPIGLCWIWWWVTIFSVVTPSIIQWFRKLKISATAAHHSIILKEVGELLVKGATEPSTGGGWF